MAFAVGLMVLLMILTVGYMPLVLPLLLEGVSVDAAKIARSLLLLMLLPLGDRARGEGALGGRGRAGQAGPRPRLQREPRSVDRAADRRRTSTRC